MDCCYASETSANKTFNSTRSTPEDLDSVVTDNDREGLHTRIRHLYGEDVLKLTRLFDNTRMKRSRFLASLAFLKRCRDSDVIPKCAQLRFSKNTGSIRRILHDTSKRILRDQIEEARRRLRCVNLQLYRLHLQLASKLSFNDWQLFDRISYEHSEKVLSLVTDKQISKFDRLSPNSQTVEDLETDKLVINLSDKVLDQPTTTALKKGLNFAVAPRRIPTERIISGLECALRHINNDEAEEIRQEASCIIRKARPPLPNMSRLELVALKKLKEDSEIIVLPADKGNATVVMNTVTYQKKMLELLTDDTYRKIKNPTKKISVQIKKLIQDSSIPSEIHRFLITSDPAPPVLYGLPKIHKEDVPMRPIVSAINSPTHKIARYIATMLTPYVGNTDTFVKDSRHFVSIIQSLHLQESDMLVSFDVKSLFTKVPLPETIDLIRNILPPDISEIATVCLRSTYFYFNGSFYEQLDGAAMGSPLSPVIANLYMEHFEQTALDAAPLRPKVFLRYVDDTFAVWPHGEEALSQFLTHLNSIHPNIQFTMEIENNRSLPFLDVLVHRKPNGQLGHSVYRKPTNTNRYLHASSHHHPIQKVAVLNTLANRAIKISDKESIKDEKEFLVKTLQQNGFSKSKVIQAIKRQENEAKSRPDHQLTVIENRAFLPYIQGVTDRISKVLKKRNIKTVFRPHLKIKGLIRPLKDKLPLHTSGVYCVPCSCDKCYIGETGRLISTRIKEHIRLTKNFDSQISAIATHSTENHHSINFDKVKVLASCDNYFERKYLEAIEIRKHSNNFNRDSGFDLSPSWTPIIAKLGRSCNNRAENSLEHSSARNENLPVTSRTSAVEGSRSSPPPPRRPYNLRRNTLRSS